MPKTTYLQRYWIFEAPIFLDSNRNITCIEIFFRTSYITPLHTRTETSHVLKCIIWIKIYILMRLEQKHHMYWNDYTKPMPKGYRFLEQKHHMYWNRVVSTQQTNPTISNRNITCIEILISVTLDTSQLLEQKHHMYWNIKQILILLFDKKLEQKHHMYWNTVTLSIRRQEGTSNRNITCIEII